MFQIEKSEEFRVGLIGILEYSRHLNHGQALVESVSSIKMRPVISPADNRP